ncbi:MAG TPA: alpha/beta hydrolase [Chitinophagaceae bacterium]|nr:alpha/beta hydrolase [Chitinophagaceae bacterium]
MQIKVDDKIVNSRKNFDNLGKSYEKADNIIIEKVIIENVDCYWFRPDGNSADNRIIIYLHGGCFVLGSIQSHQALVSHITRHLSIPALFVDYSLAPEKPFPAAINEIIHVYQHLLLLHPEADFILMGDSAGAGLSVSVLSKLNERNIPVPKYLVMFSPWVDLTCTNPSIALNAGLDTILTKAQLQEFVSLYVNDNNLAAANPVGNLHGKFPPTLILVGSGEILLDDSRVVYKKIGSQQERVKLSVYDNQNHVWMLENIHSEGSKNALKEIREFIAV